MKRLVALCVGLLLMCGCVGGLSIDQYSYVIDIGIEKGERLPYLVTLMVNTPSSQPDSEGNSGSFTVITAEGRSLFEAIETLAASQPNELNFGRTTLMMFSREFAQDDMIMESMDIALGKLRIRQNIRVIIAEGDIKSVFEGFASSSDPSTNKLKVKVTNSVNTTGMTVDTTWNLMLESFENKTQDAIVCFCGVNQQEIREDMVGGNAYPYIGGATLASGELKTSIIGSAVFSGTRMVGILDGQHTMLVQMATGKFSQGRIRVNYKDGRELSVMLFSNGAPKVSIEGDTVSFVISLVADVEMPKLIESTTSKELEDFLAYYIASESARVFTAVQNADSDVFCVGQQMIKHMENDEQWASLDFDQVYGKLNAAFTVIIKLSHDPDNVALE